MAFGRPELVSEEPATEGDAAFTQPIPREPDPIPDFELDQSRSDDFDL